MYCCSTVNVLRSYSASCFSPIARLCRCRRRRRRRAALFYAPFAPLTIFLLGVWEAGVGQKNGVVALERGGRENSSQGGWTGDGQTQLRICEVKNYPELACFLVSNDPPPPLFLCLDSLNILASLIGAETEGEANWIFPLSGRRRTNDTCTVALVIRLFVASRKVAHFSSSPDAFFSPPASFTFPWSEGGAGRWEKGVCDLSLPFPICEKVHQIRPFPFRRRNAPKEPGLGSLAFVVI